MKSIFLTSIFHYAHFMSYLYVLHKASRKEVETSFIMKHLCLRMYIRVSFRKGDNVILYMIQYSVRRIWMKSIFYHSVRPL